VVFLDSTVWANTKRDSAAGAAITISPPHLGRQATVLFGPTVKAGITNFVGSAERLKVVVRLMADVASAFRTCWQWRRNFNDYLVA
jgi:hypothetical protein